mmetsp:Transcript_126416/g.188636  ORF Transcript_126416/g.188636 Transcript_126416/m.188636 type:complete len:110 (+) Transcript_126416:207-536(+)
MARPLVSQVFGKQTFDRTTLGKHESIGGCEVRREERVCLYEEYVAATHALHHGIKKSGLLGGIVTRVLPGGFSCEVQWDDGTKGIYFQSALFAGPDVPHPPPKKVKAKS